MRDLAGWLEERGMELHSMHSPTQRDTGGRHESGMPISISDGERVRRLDAVDEVKRAIDVAERIPFKYLVQHLGAAGNRPIRGLSMRPSIRWSIWRSLRSSAA